MNQMVFIINNMKFSLYLTITFLSVLGDVAIDNETSMAREFVGSVFQRC
jgi:hypothetical protein